MVTKKDIYDSLKALGIKSPDILFVHSSLKSFGKVDGGAQTVIDALTEAVGEHGTLAMPTLSQQNWLNVYRDWNIDRPSDVGLITETFRKNAGVMRSDQATHSVCARGKYAYYITQGHCDFGPRYGLFGDYAFSHSSPWQRMYELKGYVLFMGVTMFVNTYKHFIEYRTAERILAGVNDRKKHNMLKKQLWHFSNYEARGIWAFYDEMKIQSLMQDNGMIKNGICGDCKMMLANIKQMVDFTEDLLEKEPEKWYSDEVMRWINAAE